MRRNRRHFIRTALVATAGTCTVPSLSAIAAPTVVRGSRVPSLTNLHRDITHPVRIEAVEVVETENQLFVRSRSTDGVTGTSVGNVRLPNLLSIMEGLVIPFFVGKDARDLETLVDDVYRHGRNYKYAGLPFWSCVGQVEWSLFDLLGQIALKPAARFFGPSIRTEIPVYISTWGRDQPADQTIEELRGPVERSGVRAVKLKIGGRLGPDVIPGRTQRLIPLARATFGDEMVLYADANGSYDAAEAIQVGRLLETHAYSIVEEPCPWEEFMATKAVADALDITVAGGEQDTSMPKWEWMIDNRALDLVQPDLVYNGGFIRAMRVARMAEAAGIPISPHAPAMGPEAAMKFQFAAVTPNLGAYQEHRDIEDTRSWYEPKPVIQNGMVQIPTGPGLGVTYDPEIWRSARKIV